ncbi:hypothetical protein Salat_2760900, partial [Sesamum alatum]
MNCRVNRSDPDAAVAAAALRTRPLLPALGHHSMSGIRGDILDVSTPLVGGCAPSLSIDTQLRRPITTLQVLERVSHSVPTPCKFAPRVPKIHQLIIKNSPNKLLMDWYHSTLLPEKLTEFKSPNHHP